jgi:multiple sugar transport system permease protein
MSASSVTISQRSPATRALRRVLGRDGVTAWFFLLPTTLVLVGLIGYPFVTAILLTFQDKMVGDVGRWVGFQNYIDLFSGAEVGDVFRQAVQNTIVYTAVAISAKFVLGMAQALLLHESIPGRMLLRGIFFLPWAIPSLIVAMTWKWIYAGTQVGLLNMIQLQLGLSTDLIQWLANPDLAMISVLVVVIWQGTPFWSMMFLAGLQAISAELYEAAAIDGANVVQRFRHITLPGLENVIVITCMLSTIWTANGINYVYILTGGGPANATMIFPMLAYQIGIAGAQRLGMGAAIALCFFPFFLVLIYFLSKRMLSSKQ